MKIVHKASDVWVQTGFHGCFCSPSCHERTCERAESTWAASLEVCWEHACVREVCPVFQKSNRTCLSARPTNCTIRPVSPFLISAIPKRSPRFCVDLSSWFMREMAREKSFMLRRSSYISSANNNSRWQWRMDVILCFSSRWINYFSSLSVMRTERARMGMSDGASRRHTLLGVSASVSGERKDQHRSSGVQQNVSTYVQTYKLDQQSFFKAWENHGRTFFQTIFSLNRNFFFFFFKCQIFFPCFV